MHDNQPGRSAREQAARLRRRSGHVLAWVAGGAALGYSLAPVLTLPGLAVGALLGYWQLGRAGDPAAAGRWEAGAEGEEATAALLAPLTWQGWTVLHDRAVPGSRANLDHLLVGPLGQVVLIDSKRWTQRGGATVRTVRGRLHCGPSDRHGAVETVAWEAQRVAAVLGVPVTAVVVVHGPRVVGAPLRVGPVTVVGPATLLPAVCAASGVRSPGLALRATAEFPPYR
ncbi:nuclease-related domain-containing protein [Streptacidiphilus griseoplanus]|uniref:nuclease-related domain-containing protein n=1 Tax=Peterkaempfera griseoplana TaxID=66896 RepID=UPI0006E3412C|nr:nuclease-related domain-containing protein [Peterkaempfera griseoplana]